MIAPVFAVLGPSSGVPTDAVTLPTAVVPSVRDARFVEAMAAFGPAGAVTVLDVPAMIGPDTAGSTREGTMTSVVAVAGSGPTTAVVRIPPDDDRVAVAWDPRPDAVTIDPGTMFVNSPEPVSIIPDPLTTT